MNEYPNDLMRLKIVAIVATAAMWGWCITQRPDDTNYVTALTIGGFIIAVWFAFSIYDDYGSRRRDEAWQYLLDSMEGLYFYEQPLEHCIQQNVVWKLWKNKYGDFAKPVGELVLYGLYREGNSTVKIHWKLPESINDAGSNEVKISFKYRGRNWIFNVRAAKNDQDGFKRDKKRYKESGRNYFDINRAERARVENCTDPTRSFLPPSFRYNDSESYADFEQEVKTEIKTWNHPDSD